MRNRFLLCVACAALATASLSAHDFWLAASDWVPAAGAPVTISAGIGEEFPIRTEFKSRPDWFDVWRVIGASGEVAVSKDFQQRDLTMATQVTLPSAGAFLGVMRVTPRTIEMKGPAFTDYLKEEGLDSVIAARQAAGEADKPAKEVYARYAKLAIRTGSGGALHLSQPVGLKAEFVPTTDPTSIRPGGMLTVQLLTEGKPVAGATVTGVSEGISVKGLTDADGRVTLQIGRAGAWLVKTVRMVRVPQTGSAEADWESYWVTLAFHTQP